MPKPPPRRYVTCEWCGKSEPEVKAGVRCYKCHTLYSIDMDYTYFVNAVRDQLGLAPLKRQRPQKRLVQGAN